MTQNHYLGLLHELIDYKIALTDTYCSLVDRRVNALRLTKNDDLIDIKLILVKEHLKEISRIITNSMND